MHLTYRRRLVLVSAAALVVGLPLGAQAVAPFGAAHRVLPVSCAGSQTALGSDGARHGFTTCRLANGSNALYAVTGSPGATTWTRTRVATNVGYLLAASDDGHSSYALFDTAGGVLELATRARSGSTHLKKLASTRQYGLGSGALLAKNGNWLAVWSAGTKLMAGSGCYQLFQAGTLHGFGATRNTKICGSEPSLAFGSSGKPVLVYRVGLVDYGSEIDLRKSHAGRWSKPHAVTAKNQAGRTPTISVVGNTTRVAWLQFAPRNRYLAHLATKVGRGPWHTHTFAQPGVFDTVIDTRPQTAESHGNAFIAWTIANSKHKETVHVEEYAGGKWTQRNVGDGTGGDAVLDQLASINGRAYLVISHSDETVYDLTTQQ
jgi:hypothetical protein